MPKRVVSLTCAFVLLLPALIACSPAPAPPAKEAPAKPAAEAKPAAAQSTQSVELVLGHFVPTKHEMHEDLMEPWAKEVEQKSNGRLKVTIHPGASLGPPPSQYKNVVAGAMDVGFGLQSYTPGRFPLSEMISLPFLWKSGEQATTAFWELYQTTPEVQKEYSDVKVLALWTHGLGSVFTAKKPVKTLDDLKGLKLRSPGAVHNKLVEALGAVPVTMPVNDLYDSVERGVVDGAVITPSIFPSFKLDEVVKYVTITGPGQEGIYVSTFFLVMNKESWDKLSPENQKLLDDLSGKALALKGARAYDQSEDEGTQYAKGKGVQFHTLTDDEVKKWREASASVSDDYVKQVSEKEPAAKKVYDQIVSMAKKG